MKPRKSRRNGPLTFLDSSLRTCQKIKSLKRLRSALNATSADLSLERWSRSPSRQSTLQRARSREANRSVITTRMVTIMKTEEVVVAVVKTTRAIATMKIRTCQLVEALITLTAVRNAITMLLRMSLNAKLLMK